MIERTIVNCLHEQNQLKYQLYNHANRYYKQLKDQRNTTDIHHATSSSEKRQL